MADVQVEHGYTRLANELLEALARAPLPGPRHFQVMLAMIRLLYGYNRSEDRIAASQVAALTGLELRNVQAVLTELVSARTLERFLTDCESFCESVRVVKGADILRQYPDVIFEGAQGLLLDQDHPWFPHVTPSHTGLRNVAKLCCEAGIEHLDVTYVTRGYVTRHGAGPFPFDPLEYTVSDSTNVEHPYQGRLRTGVLDAGLLRETIALDLAQKHAIGLTVDAGLAITCLDHVKNAAAKLHGMRLAFDDRALWVDWIEEATGFPVRLTSMGPTRTHVAEWK